MSDSLLGQAAKIINGTRSLLPLVLISEVEEWNEAYADYLKQNAPVVDVPDPKTVPYTSTIVDGMVSDDG